MEVWAAWGFCSVARKEGFPGELPFKDFLALCSSFTLAMFGERDKALLRSVLVAGVEWFCECLAGFVVVMTIDGHLFWDFTFPPLIEIYENPEFHDLMETDESC